MLARSFLDDEPFIVCITVIVLFMGEVQRFRILERSKLFLFKPENVPPSLDTCYVIYMHKTKDRIAV